MERLSMNLIYYTYDIRLYDRLLIYNIWIIKDNMIYTIYDILYDIKHIN